MRTIGRRRPKRGEELQRRDVEVVSIHTFMSLHVVAPKGAEPSIGSDPCLEVRGNVNEPIRDVTEFVINVQAKELPKPGPSGRYPSVRSFSFTRTYWPSLRFHAGSSTTSGGWHSAATLNTLT
jgi:hypothetical protein